MTAPAAGWPIRTLPLETADGATLMAQDEWLLHQAATTGEAALRFYTWAEPTMSLGYFQPATERRPGLPWVRRSTGGAALVHHHELTYALALPPGADWQPRGESWICRVHHVIQAVLLQAEQPTEAVVCGREQKLGPVLCFLHQTPGDVLAAGRKVVGSAQRKYQGGLLQHGGILLAQSPYTPELPGVQELLGATWDPGLLAARLELACCQSFGWRPMLRTWSADELSEIQRIRTDKYANQAWNLKR